ncbi:hypothetical protein HW115_04600 [Verrucomicrobiaceae bacterium N1E253]|uniref:Uncharacterized protein n=1 Tax=Oceaniferula marina TaxID=2748318 RepID=A0A851GBS7_9BACT|nr:hypothetical protein [Oceaniferula marina]NWK54876.1 hypothetical protein [Oceaniferula marina]
MMERNYKQSVTVFGLVLPMLFAVLCAVGLFIGLNYVNKTYQLKNRNYQQDQVVQREISLLKKQVVSQNETLSEWEALLAAENRRSFTQHWKDVGQTFKPNEFNMDLPTWQNQSRGLGKALPDQPASQVKMSFNATFRAMQTALMEIETRLPQLQLDSMKMKPSDNGKTLNFETTFTLWTER